MAYRGPADQGGAQGDGGVLQQNTGDFTSETEGRPANVEDADAPRPSGGATNRFVVKGSERADIDDLDLDPLLLVQSVRHPEPQMDAVADRKQAEVSPIPANEGAADWQRLDELRHYRLGFENGLGLDQDRRSISPDCGYEETGAFGWS